MSHGTTHRLPQGPQLLLRPGRDPTLSHADCGAEGRKGAGPVLKRPRQPFEPLPGQQYNPPTIQQLAKSDFLSGTCERRGNLAECKLSPGVLLGKEGLSETRSWGMTPHRLPT